MRGISLNKDDPDLLVYMAEKASAAEYADACTLMEAAVEYVSLSDADFKDVLVDDMKDVLADAKEDKAEDAQKDGAELLQPTVDTVTYSDGTTEEVYGFDIPVTVIDQEFDLALIGKKGVWYDHKVSIENPLKDE